MKKLLLVVSALSILCQSAFSQDLQQIPSSWKWLDDSQVAFTYDGSYTDAKAFSILTKKYTRRDGIKAPFRFTKFPVSPEGAVNLTYSPDSTMLGFTRDNDLWVVEIATGKETRLTFDGSELILNGYASWVYYEEILGRPSQYRAFWWSPDSRKIGFYRFDNSRVPMFPIYSPKGQDGSLRQTRYPKCGEPNPEVRIGMVDVLDAASTGKPSIVWADFNEKDDQYFGIPFWGADSQSFFISREPRTQNTLDLYAVSVKDGSKNHIYHETYKTWLDWIEGMIFGQNGLYMVRNFETGWQQIYYLSYDGKTFRRLTDGKNWRVNILKVDEKKGDVFFTANRESTIRTGVYKVNAKGEITALTDPAFNAASVSFSPTGSHFVASLSNFTTPSQVWIIDAAKPSKSYKVADMAGKNFTTEGLTLPQNVTMTTKDGLTLPAFIVYPKDFDPSKKYPVHMDIYGGPDTPQVKERWVSPTSYKWYSDNGIIEITADCRASGHNGREGLDQIYRQLDQVEVQDFVEWAQWLQALPYVKGDKIGVEGFSFGGTMTSLLVMDHPEAFHYGIAGGGVYDWSLYDTHYTERFMDTPQNNPEGYARTRAISHVKNYVTEYGAKYNGVEPVMLKITHGTGDDNVHYQNTLQLIDELQKGNKKVDFMVYPDGMHGYRGYQGTHFQNANHEFWQKYLLSE
ncbi:MAG: S9 family peptidase [Bacteroidales bacterium]|nr:S9 family peptidase [Bacteroidales bacterium]